MALMVPALGVRSAGREAVFGWAFLLLTINAATTIAAVAMVRDGMLMAAFNLFDVSAIVWLAAAAGGGLLFRREAQPARLARGDLVMLAACLVAMLLPVPALSAAAASALALWVWTTSQAGSPLRRASLIFASVTTSLLWGRMLLGLASDTMLSLDGAMVSLFSGAGGHANMVMFAGRDTGFVVAPGCSSLHGVSLAAVLWVTVTQYFNLSIGRRTWATLCLAMFAAITANVLRLATMSRMPEHFDSLHTGAGAALFGWLALILVTATIWWGLKNDLAKAR